MKIGHHIIDLRCPTCGDVHDRATNVGTFEQAIGVEPKPPVEGDFNVCFNCGGVHRYTKEMTLRRITREERHIVPEKAQKLSKIIQDKGRIRVSKH